MWEDRVSVGVVLYCTCSPGMVALCVCMCVSERFILSQSFPPPPPSLLPLLVPLGCRNLPLWSGTNVIVLKHARIYIINMQKLNMWAQAKRSRTRQDLTVTFLSSHKTFKQAYRHTAQVCQHAG